MFYIDVCCFFSLLNYKYLLLNYLKTLKYSIAGGNQEINNLQEKGHSFEECLETSVIYKRNDVSTLLL